MHTPTRIDGDAGVVAAVLTNCCPVELIVPPVRPKRELYQSCNCAKVSRPGRHLAFAYVIIAGAAWAELLSGAFDCQASHRGVQDVEGQTPIH